MEEYHAQKYLITTTNSLLSLKKIQLIKIEGLLIFMSFFED